MTIIAMKSKWTNYFLNFVDLFNYLFVLSSIRLDDLSDYLNTLQKFRSKCQYW